MTRLIRLTGGKRAAFNGADIDGRVVVQLEFVSTLPDGEKSLTRMRSSAERAGALAVRQRIHDVELDKD
uniref:hypothetical protein n=1 Tax=Pseudomonas sp. 79_C TaxID=2813567 RepID=UPI001A9E4463